MDTRTHTPTLDEVEIARRAKDQARISLDESLLLQQKLSDQLYDQSAIVSDRRSAYNKAYSYYITCDLNV